METELPVLDFEDTQILSGPLIPLLFSLALFPLGWILGYTLLGAVIASIFIVVCLTTAYYDGVGKRGVKYLDDELTIFTTRHGSTVVNLSRISRYQFRIKLHAEDDCPIIEFEFVTGELEPKEFDYAATKFFDEHCRLRDLISKRIARQWLAKLQDVDHLDWTQGFVIERTGIRNSTAKISYTEIASISQKEGWDDTILELRGRDGTTFEFGTKWVDFFPFCELLKMNGVYLPEIHPFKSLIPDPINYT